MLPGLNMTHEQVTISFIFPIIFNVTHEQVAISFDIIS